MPAVSGFFNTGKILKQINAIMVSLIPKVASPISASQLGPILCCNVIYKCISKILYNRMAKVLPDLVTDTQASFVKERSLIHNVLMYHDIFGHYDRKTNHRCLMNIDL